MRSFEAKLAKLEEVARSVLRRRPRRDEPCTCETQEIYLRPYMKDSRKKSGIRYLTEEELQIMLPFQYPKGEKRRDSTHCSRCGGLNIAVPIDVLMMAEEPIKWITEEDRRQYEK